MADRAPYPHKKRIHRRIVFEEVCCTLYKVLSYADFTKGVAQLVYAGFVHRDISPGNCLIYNGQTKISDLEYARPYAAPGHGAAPLTRGTHLFDHHPSPVTIFLFPGEAPPPTPTPWFKFNFLHDLESVIWIYLWFLLDTLPEAFTPAQIKQHSTTILALNYMLFNGSLNVSAERLSFVEHCTIRRCTYYDVVDALRAVHGIDFKLLKALQFFQSLCTAYQIVQLSQHLLAESPQATHWDRKVFLHKFYQAIHIYLMDAHEQMKDKSNAAQPLSDSLREAKHRAMQRAERPSANKRARTCEDNEDYVPPVRPDEDEDSDAASDSTSNETSSTTEETQFWKKKRQRGDWA
ncbi:hypothetical protein CPB85DRAFT_1361542 [Mucidula mucida]|nr:hypothetical protein CPB85DRAFT_1361542 [Mucidula mucida]